DLACAMYDLLIEKCEASGLRQYEVANFARDRETTETVSPASELADGRGIPAYACRHNVNYWRNGSYYGLGPAACGYVEGVRTGNWGNVHLYCDQIEQGRRAIAWRDELTPIQRAGEAAAFGLRMVQGWGLEEFRQRTGFDLLSGWRLEIQDLVERGWGVLEPDRFRLTSQGIRFADAAGTLFLR
ncbi:coproporphyrinogen III oxidase, partial [Candidatus Parcubacteria bacterium]